MFCPNCGKELPNGSQFCSGCGKKFATNVTPAAPKQKAMVLTTTPMVEGYRITEYLGTVTGTEIYLVGGLIGGGLANQEKLFGNAYTNALTKMQTKAKEMGADAVVGITVNFTGAANTGSVIVALVGTAVRLEPIS